MSDKNEIIADNLTETLESALSQPPSSAGRRLRSERDLANLFKMDHFQVRKSLDKFSPQRGTGEKTRQWYIRSTCPPQIKPR